jgi:Bacterial archaeo-eukaryotic release factor family 7
MMHIPPKSELRVLMEPHNGPCLSLFLPTDTAGMDMQQKPLRLRNQLREAEHHLLLNNLPAPQVEALLEPMRALLEDAPFWLHPAEGLAVFRSPEFFCTYWLPRRFKEQVIVTRHFYLKPLLPFLTDDGHFFILALCHNHIRLLEGTHDSVGEVAVPEAVPQSQASAMNYDEADNELQYHSSSSGAVGGMGGRRATIAHGQAVGSDDEKELLLRSFQQIDRSVHARLGDEQVPLVLAGVASLFPIYREANTYPHLLDQGAPGNPDRLSLETLHQRAWAVVEPSFLRTRQEEAARYREYAATGRASNKVREIVPAAYGGRIESLFLAINQEQWGIFHPATRTLHIRRQVRFNDDDLLDMVATQTLLHGGSVYAVEQTNMPDQGLFAAAFRY